MYCQRCKVTGVKLIKNKKYKNGSFGYMCTACNTERLKKYRLTDEGKAAALRASKKYHSSNLEKYLAWNKVRWIKHEPCVVCGKKETHGHHPDYSKPREVIFLCALHHKQIHLYKSIPLASI